LQKADKSTTYTKSEVDSIAVPNRLQSHQLRRLTLTTHLLQEPSGRQYGQDLHHGQINVVSNQLVMLIYQEQ
ncbi:MAG: hypothetical protein ACKPKO_32365, partial [Candidatus Fonsibacter sp.]